MKKFVSIILVIVLVFLAAITVFLFIQNNNLKKEIEVLNKKIEDLQKPTLTPITETPPEGWKEYIDSGYKFKLWYPEKFTDYGETAEVRVEKLKNDYGIKDNWINLIQVYMPLSSDAPVGLIAIYIYNNTSSIKSFIKADVERLMGKSLLNIEEYTSVEKINNIGLYKVEIPDKLIRYYTKNDKNLFVFEGENIIELKGNLLLIFKQIVHSFRFIE